MRCHPFFCPASVYTYMRTHTGRQFCIFAQTHYILFHLIMQYVILPKKKDKKVEILCKQPHSAEGGRNRAGRFSTYIRKTFPQAVEKSVGNGVFSVKNARRTDKFADFAALADAFTPCGKLRASKKFSKSIAFRPGLCYNISALRDSQRHLPVAQLDSASDSDSEGRRFESFRVGQKHTQRNMRSGCVCFFTLIFISSVRPVWRRPAHRCGGLTPHSAFRAACGYPAYRALRRSCPFRDVSRTESRIPDPRG